MTIKSLTCGALAALSLSAQTPVPKTFSVPVPVNTIDIRVARSAFNDVPKADLAIGCDVPLDGHPELSRFCGLIRNLVDPPSSTVFFAMYATQDQSLWSSFLSGVADSNLGTHLGSNPGAPGTANAVERSGYIDVLRLALESGAITDSVSGTTLNLQANSLSLYRLLVNKDVFQYCPGGTMSCQGPTAEILNRISGSAALSVSNVTTQSVTGTVAGSNASGNSPANSSGNSTLPSATALIQNGPTRLSSVTIHGQIWSSLDLRSKTLEARREGKGEGARYVAGILHVLCQP